MPDQRPSSRSVVDDVQRALNALPPDVLTAQTALAAKHAVGAVVEWIRREYAEDAADATFSYYGLALADDLERSLQ